MTQEFDRESIESNRLPSFWYVGPVLLFVAAMSYGVLEVHPVNDTWTGLAAGRQILASGAVPLTDSFSFSAAGKPWYNQNWLAHTIQYWVYDRIGHDAIIIVNWITAGLIFILAALGAYWRSHNWILSLVAGAVTAFGCRDYLSARPATMGFFCLAGLSAVICAIEGQRSRRRWTPIFLLGPLFLFWGGAHGSFIFGYGAVGLYIAGWIFSRLRRCATTANSSQIIVLSGVVAAAAVLTILFGPFGLDNFLHGQKVAGSNIWRDVAEWQPAYVTGHIFQPVWRFWTILAMMGALLSTAGMIRLCARQDANQIIKTPIRLTLFDIIMVCIGLGMSIWARRFVPIFLIFGVPATLLLVLSLLGPVNAALKLRLTKATALLCGIGGVCLGSYTIYRAHADLITPYRDRPDFGLLERVTRFEDQPLEAYNFIDRNKLELKLTAEWSLASSVILHAPTAKVFIDGRAQQVYEENHYRQYQALFVSSNTPHEILHRILDEIGSDSVLVRNWERGANLWAALEKSADWSPVIMYPTYRLYLRNRSAPIEKLGDLLRAGEVWWPNTSMSEVARGFVWLALKNPEPERAIQAWKTALRKNPSTGLTCFEPLSKAMRQAGRTGEARQLLQAYLKRLDQDSCSRQASRELLRDKLMAALTELDGRN